MKTTTLDFFMLSTNDCIIINWQACSIARKSDLRKIEENIWKENGEWSDNWCLDSPTCLYTHHYHPCMIDKYISYYIIFAYFFVSVYLYGWCICVVVCMIVLSVHDWEHISYIMQNRLLKCSFSQCCEILILYCACYEFKNQLHLQGQGWCYRIWCSLATLNINWEGPWKCLLREKKINQEEKLMKKKLESISIM